jgi:hypothetical protein
MVPIGLPMKKLEKIKSRKEMIEKEIEALSAFRKTPELEKFLRQLQGERSFVTQKIEQATKSLQQKEIERAERLQKAQHNRSEKNKRNWRYVNAMSKTWGYPPRKVRSEIKKRRQGLKSDIDDIKWRNPSP